MFCFFKTKMMLHMGWEVFRRKDLMVDPSCPWWVQHRQRCTSARYQILGLQMIKMRPGGWLAREESLGVVSPSESIKVRVDVGLMIEDHFSSWVSFASSWVSFASVGPIPERPTRNGSGEMVRVACTLRGKRLDGGVFVLSVGVNPVWSWETRWQVDMC
jgi:hypothetical protein